jgi:hypothetical protein
MKPSALQRLVKHARQNKAFVKLLRENPTAAFRSLPKAGIKLSPKEVRLVKKVLSDDEVVLSPDELKKIASLNAPAAKARGLGPGPGIWPIRCLVLLVWSKGARARFSSKAGGSYRK